MYDGGEMDDIAQCALNPFHPYIRYYEIVSDHHNLQ